MSDIMSNKNRHRRRTDSQTETGDPFFRPLVVMKRRENKNNNDLCKHTYHRSVSGKTSL